MTEVNKAFLHSAAVIALWKEAGREMLFTISGASMEPVLKAGDRVTVRPVRPEEIKKGDIVAFSEGEKIIVHRMVGKRVMDGIRVYCQKGDNLGGFSWIPEEAIIGKVVSVKGAGYVAEMSDFPWRWLNPLLGIWGAGWSAFESILRTIGKVIVWESSGAIVSGVKLTLRDGQLLLPRCLLRLYPTKSPRRHIPGARRQD